MDRRMLGTVVLGLGLLASRVQAADSTGKYLIQGTGVQNCALVLDGADLSLPATLWISGFLTATNLWTPETFSINPGGEIVWQWVAQYCRMNPQKTLAQAMQAFVYRAMPARQTTEPAILYPDTPARMPQWEPPPSPQKSIPVKSRKRS